MHRYKYPVGPPDGSFDPDNPKGTFGLTLTPHLFDAGGRLPEAFATSDSPVRSVYDAAYWHLVPLCVLRNGSMRDLPGG